MSRILTALMQLKRDERGVAALEYSLIAALVAIVAIGVVNTVGANLSATFDGIASHFSNGTVTP
jgi:Flp pilus assembly pilin Flp